MRQVAGEASTASSTPARRRPRPSANPRGGASGAEAAPGQNVDRAGINSPGPFSIAAQIVENGDQQVGCCDKYFNHFGVHRCAVSFLDRGSNFYFRCEAEFALSSVRRAANCRRPQRTGQTLTRVKVCTCFQRDGPLVTNQGPFLSPALKHHMGQPLTNPRVRRVQLCVQLLSPHLADDPGN